MAPTQTTEWLPLTVNLSQEAVTIKRKGGKWNRSEHPHEAVTLDFDRSGNLIGIEVLASPKETK